MKDIYKNPALYYIAAPIAAALWPLVVWAMYLPKARESWNHEKQQYNKAESLAAEILALDRDRLEFADSPDPNDEFDYARTVEKVATLCRIPPTNYTLSSGIIIQTAEQKSQSAKVVLKGVDIARFARFLSTIQLRWANLQCTQVKLTKKKGLPDSWDADLDFKYYY